MPESVNVIEQKKKKSYKITTPPMYDVFIYNDDKTPMDVVVKILCEAFDKDLATAFHIMLAVHSSDKGVVGTYSMEEAYARVEKADEIIEECEVLFGFTIPLQLTVESH